MRLEKFDLTKFSNMYGIMGRIVQTPEESVFTGTMLGLLTPGELTRKHAHHDNECFTIIQGKGIMVVNDVEYTIEPGDQVHLSPGEKHILKNTEATSNLVFITNWWSYSQGAVIPKIEKVEYKDLKSRIIFSPPPTPNGNLHLGHLSGPYIAADILRCYLKQCGNPTHYVTGSDDYQNYVELKAKQMGRSNKEVADTFSISIEETLKKFNASPDIFYRPLHDARYEDYVKTFFIKLFTDGKLLSKTFKQYYCDNCQMWMHESHLTGTCHNCNSSCGGGACESCGLTNDGDKILRPYCKHCKSEPKIKDNEQIYFPLDNYREKLIVYYNSVNLPPRVRNLVRESLNKPLPDLAVTQSSTWGISAPFVSYEDRKLCSWCEMVPAYLLRIREHINSRDDANNTKLTLLFGFDNTYFFTVIMPALFMANEEIKLLPSEFIYNEFYLFDNIKFSTSTNHAVWGDEIIKKTKTDYVRYYLAASRPEHQQTLFTYADFVDLINTDLVSGLSSLISDTLKKVQNLYNGICPDGGVWASEHEDFIVQLDYILKRATRLYHPDNFSPAGIVRLLREVVTIASELSTKCDLIKPGLYLNDIELSTSIVLQLTALKYYSMICSPIMPEISSQIAKALGFPSIIPWEDEVRIIAKDTKLSNLQAIVLTPIVIEDFKENQNPESGKNE